MDVAVGAKLLADVQEESLEETLNSLRRNYEVRDSSSRIKKTHIPELDDILSRQFQSTKSATISVTGRYLPLVNKILSTIVSPPHRMAVFVVDLEGRFDATRLTCDMSDLHHIYVQAAPRSTPEAVRALVSEVEGFMLYHKDARVSADRELWGTIVLGGFGAGDLVAGWKGWLRVDREHVRPFPPDITLEEALEQKEARNRAVQKAGWEVTSQWGGFVFHERNRDTSKHEQSVERLSDMVT